MQFPVCHKLDISLSCPGTLPQAFPSLLLISFHKKVSFPKVLGGCLVSHLLGQRELGVDP